MGPTAIALALVSLAACGSSSGDQPAIDGAPGSGSAHADAALDAPVDPPSVPTDPIDFDADTVFTLDSGTTNWVVVPHTYDATHQTPMQLLVWLHGCEGHAEGDIYMLSPILQTGGTQDWISLAVGGTEGGCWDPAGDQQKVTAALANIETHFNIKRHGVVLGGYSSGGDLGYRTVFDHTDLFAGLIAENTSPFRDTGASAHDSLAAATWKINIAHLAHLDDTTYPIDGVRTETDAVTAAGFPLQRIERHGGHYDGDHVNTYPGSDQPVPGTTADFQTYLLPMLDAGWRSP